MIEGIDVSVFQGKVDWKAVAEAGVKFAVCRATVGLGTDPNFLTNVAGAKAVGLLVGAYHAYETAHDPIEQAKHFASVAAGVIDLCPFLDFEGGTKGIDHDRALAMAQSFCETADNLFTKTCGVYTFPYFWNGLVAGDLAGTEWCVDRPFWLALYPGKNDPEPLKPFSSVDIHQYSGTSVDVPGVHTTCDRDRFYGTLEELLAVGVYIPPYESGPGSEDTLPGVGCD